MAITEVLIKDMPGPSWWEFLFQWSGLLISFLAAAGTLAAVWVALRNLRQEAHKQRAEQNRECTVVWEIVIAEVTEVQAALTGIILEINDLLDPKAAIRTAQDRLERVVFLTKSLEMPGSWRLVDKISWLPSTVAVETARLMALCPTVVKRAPSVIAWRGGVPELLDHATSLRDFCQALLTSCEMVAVERLGARSAA